MHDRERSAFDRGWLVIAVALITGLVMFASGTPARASTGTVVCAPSTGQVKGIDVSSFEGAIDFSQVAAAGYKFVYARATQGTSLTDPEYAANRSDAEAAGLSFGAYAFFDPTENPVTQADYFLSVATPTDGELVPMLDVETTDTTLTPSEYAAAVKSWLDTVQQALGVQPIVYTSNYLWNDETGGAGGDTTVPSAGYPLWIPNWSVPCPTIPTAWSSWLVWQTTDAGAVSGVPGTQTDVDDFNASATGGSLTPFAIGQESLPVVAPSISIGGALGGSGTSISAPPGTSAPVIIGCNGVAGQTCSGTLIAASRETTIDGKPVSVGPNVRGTVKQVVVATESYSVAAGGTETVDMTLNATGRALLGRFYKLPATLALPGDGSVGLTYTYRVVTASISSGFQTGARGGTRVSRLAASGLPVHARVEVICHGGGCPFHSRTFKAHGARLDLVWAFAGHVLASGATVRVTVGVEGEVGRVFVFRMRRSRKPLATRLCLAPGNAAPSACAA
jgi:lysozyme